MRKYFKTFIYIAILFFIFIFFYTFSSNAATNYVACDPSVASSCLPGESCVSVILNPVYKCRALGGVTIDCAPNILGSGLCTEPCKDTAPDYICRPTTPTCSGTCADSNTKTCSVDWTFGTTCQTTGNNILCCSGSLTDKTTTATTKPVTTTKYICNTTTHQCSIGSSGSVLYGDLNTCNISCAEKTCDTARAERLNNGCTCGGVGSQSSCPSSKIIVGLYNSNGQACMTDCCCPKDSTTTKPPPDPGTGTGGSGSPLDARCSNDYKYAFWLGTYNSAGEREYRRECSCTAGTKPASEVKVFDAWKCTCEEKNNYIKGQTYQDGNYCCGPAQDVPKAGPLTTTCLPQSPSKYSGATENSCFNLDNASNPRPATCKEGGGSSWCCYKVDTAPYTGTYSRCSDKYRYCFAKWTTDSAGLDTPKTTYTKDCACDDTKVELTLNKCGNVSVDMSDCTSSTATPAATITPAATLTPGATGGPGGGTGTPGGGTGTPGGGTGTPGTPGTPTSTPTPAPACGGTCTKPADCAGAKDGCTYCSSNKTCTTPFNPSSCTCDGIEATGLFSGQPVTVTSYSKIIGSDIEKAKVVSEKFTLTKGTAVIANIIAKSDDIPSELIERSASLVRYRTQWQFTLPQLEKGAVYRLWSTINCQPTSITYNYNSSAKNVVLGAETKSSFWDNFIGFFSNLFGLSKDNSQKESSVTAVDKVPTLTPLPAKKTIQIGTFKQATIVEKSCSTIIFRQE